MIDNGKVIDRMNVAIKEMPESERKVARYILENIEDTLYLNTSQLAKKSGVGESTVVRACQTLGYKGYKELKINLALEISSNTDYSPLIPEEVNLGPNNNGLEELTRKIFLFNKLTLEGTLEVLDINQLRLALDVIVASRRIEVFGSGTQMHVASYAQSKFLSTGIPCTCRFNSAEQYGLASVLTEGDVLMVISHSGYVIDQVRCVNISRKKGAKTIAITSSAESPLGMAADIVLLTQGKDVIVKDEQTRVELLTAKVAQIALIDAIVSGIAMLIPDVVIPNMLSMRKGTAFVKFSNPNLDR